MSLSRAESLIGENNCPFRGGTREILPSLALVAGEYNGETAGGGSKRAKDDEEGGKDVD